MALATRSLAEGRIKRAAVLAGILGASLFFGECTITPAISVLAAIEGLKVVDPTFESLVVPLSVIVLLGLFAVQRYGTGRVGAMFGPITACWFIVIGALGVSGIAVNPSVLRALSPHHAVLFFAHHDITAFLVLGAVILVVTGAEALFADMGHFGRAPIRIARLVLVLPALSLNYSARARCCSATHRQSPIRSTVSRRTGFAFPSSSSPPPPPSSRARP
jgi:K+ transporter